MVQAGAGLSQGRGVAEPAHSPLHVGQAALGVSGAGLLVDALNPVRRQSTNLTTVRGLDGGNGCVDVFWDHVPLAEHAAGHVVLAMVRFMFDHLVVRLEASSGDLGHRQLRTGWSSRLR